MDSLSSEKPGMREEVSPEEWKLRQELAAAYRIAADCGWDDLLITHFSARVPGTDRHFLLNPFGLLFEEITASNLVKVDQDGNGVVPTDYAVNPAGFIIHGAIHGARDDAHVILHTHTVEGMAIAAQEEGLLPITQTSLSVYGDLAYHDFEGIVLDADERERLLPDIGDKNNVILRNHGLMTLGGTVGEAFLRMHTLQRACEAQVMAQAGGKKLILLSPEVQDRVDAQTRVAGAPLGHFTGEALLRKAARLDPGFSD